MYRCTVTASIVCTAVSLLPAGDLYIEADEDDEEGYEYLVELPVGAPENTNSLVIKAYSGGEEKFSGNVTDFEAFCKLPEQDD
jgi:hypothetical protein